MSIARLQLSDSFEALGGQPRDPGLTRAPIKSCPKARKLLSSHILGTRCGCVGRASVKSRRFKSVSRDSVVWPPRYLRWVCERWPKAIIRSSV